MNLYLPHVLTAFVSLDGGQRILNVRTDLEMSPGKPGYDDIALDTLNRALGKLINLRNGYDRVLLKSKDAK